MKEVFAGFMYIKLNMIVQTVNSASSFRNITNRRQLGKLWEFAPKFFVLGMN
jgi:hypothetical protein